MHISTKSCKWTLSLVCDSTWDIHDPSLFQYSLVNFVPMLSSRGRGGWEEVPGN